MPDILSVVKPDPEKIRPIVFDSPHSGTVYPDDFDYVCSDEDLRRTEDQYVDDLFSCTPDYGAALLKAHFSRSYIDVNREIDDIDPALIAGAWPKDSDDYPPLKPTPRSAAGIGLIRRLVKPGVPVYDRFLSPEEIKARIEDYYIPYHKTLASLLNDAHYNYGQVWHINCHSMPASSATPKQPIGFVAHHAQQADFCLGTRDGRTCGAEFLQAMRSFLDDLGYTVTVNDPFKGVTLIRAYSAPTIGRHSVQLEINRALYMNEESGEKSKDYPAFKGNIEKLVAFCAAYADSQLMSLAAD